MSKHEKIKQKKFKKVDKRIELTKHIISQLESQLSSLNSAYAAHVDIDDQGDVYSIAVFTDGTRNPKTMIGQVEKIFQKVVRSPVDYRKISIIEQELETPAERDERVKLVSAYTVQKGNEVIEGVVTLKNHQELIEEKMQVLSSEKKVEDLIAQVTAKALTKIFEDKVSIHCVKEARIGQLDVIFVMLAIINRYEAADMLVGKAVFSKDLTSSVAKATLNAINRKLKLSPFLPN